MLMPVGDDNPRRSIGLPVVTIALIAVCVAVFLWQASLAPQAAERAIYALGAIPAVITGEATLPASWVVVPAEATLITSMFLHGDWLHLFGNMLFLWVFGDNIEDACGHLRYLLFYLAAGIAAVLIYIVSDPASPVPVVGASGAISGVLGAYLVLHPRARITIMIFIGVFVTLRAVVVLGLWIAFQVFNALLPQAGGDGGGIAWWAHIGGFAVGALLIVVARRRGVPLFSPETGVVARRSLIPGRSVIPSSRGRQ
jgi:membrane associated rhomboid family serine protease